MANEAMNKAKGAKQDEFYTQLKDVETEMSYYRHHFEGKTIFLNCDDPDWSAFWQYFNLNFDFLGLKKLISTHYVYDDNEEAYALIYESQPGTNEEKVTKITLKGDGDFRSDEAVEYLKEADIVITNPPFSLFREYIAQLMEYNKHFIVLGNQNAFTYKEIFPLLQDNKMWVGYKYGDMAFRVPNYYKPRKTRFWIDKKGQKWRSMGNICWFTNLEIPKLYEDLILTEFYEGNEDKYPFYDNYDGVINVNRVTDIPMDYKGVMGVPITFFNKFNPQQFKIVGLANSARYLGDYEVYTIINGERIYNRIMIQNKYPKSRAEVLGF